MKRQWKPGDVVVVTEYDEPLIALVQQRDGSAGLWFAYADGGFDLAGPAGIGDGEVLDIAARVAARPLVVIDPEDESDGCDVTRLANLIRAHHADDGVQVGLDWISLQAALREFANPTPKPDEPTGLGAVVEDEDGERWVRFANHQPASRNWATDGGDCSRWSEIAAVRVLSEGVQP